MSQISFSRLLGLAFQDLFSKKSPEINKLKKSPLISKQIDNNSSNGDLQYESNEKNIIDSIVKGNESTQNETKNKLGYSIIYIQNEEEEISKTVSAKKHSLAFQSFKKKSEQFDAFLKDKAKEDYEEEEKEFPKANENLEKHNASFLTLQHEIKSNHLEESFLSADTFPDKNAEKPNLRNLILLSKPVKNNTRQRIKTLLVEAVPVYIYSIVSIFMDSITMSFLGHYEDDTTLNGVALGNSWINATGIVILVGFSASLNTIGSQESGRGNFEEVGLQYHKSLIISMLLAVILNGINQFIGQIFSVLGQLPEIIPYVETYVRIYSLGLFPFAISNSTVSFLESQKLFRPQSIATVLTIIIHPLICLIFIGWLRLGAVGAGWAMVTTQFINLIILFSTIFFWYFSKVKKSFFFFIKESFIGFSDIIKTGSLTCLLTCLEWWCLEASTFLSGRCGVDNSAAHATIAVPVENLIYLVAYSFATVNQAYLGNYLGENNQKEFLAYCKLGPMVGFFIVALMAMLVLSLKNYIPYLIVDDPNVVKEATKIIPLMVTYVLFDGVQVLFGATMKGIGKFGGAIWSNIIPFYGIGLPLAYYFAYVWKDGDVIGIWSGILIGIICVNLCYGVIILRINIYKEMQAFREEVLKELEGVLELSIASSEHVSARDLVSFYMQSKKKKSAILSVADKQHIHPN